MTNFNKSIIYFGVKVINSYSPNILSTFSEEIIFSIDYSVENSKEGRLYSRREAPSPETPGKRLYYS